MTRFLLFVKYALHRIAQATYHWVSHLKQKQKVTVKELLEYVKEMHFINGYSNNNNGNIWNLVCTVDIFTAVAFVIFATIWLMINLPDELL